MNLARELSLDMPLTVAQYMARCNDHYYATRDPFGVKGDFTTGPEISQIFGELIGAWAAGAWQRMGCPRVLLCELGPGRGTLMQDALRATRKIEGFHDALDVHLVETSPVLRNIQQKTLSGAHPRITWHKTLNGLPPLPLLLIANEFFDALPVEQYVKVGLKEIKRNVHYDGKRLFWQPEGEVIRESSPASEEIMKQIAMHIHRFDGAALIIDYGHANPSPLREEVRWGADVAKSEQNSPHPNPPPTGEGIRGADTLQAVRNHQYADPLETPGEADLTAHVDFAALTRAARERGAYAHGPVEQGTFLKRLGAELRATALCKAATQQQRDAILSGLERIMSPHQMGRLFKVMAVTKSVEAPAGF